jgi:flagellar biosynthesis/type III secretory pathway protein FliH
MDTFISIYAVKPAPPPLAAPRNQAPESEPPRFEAQSEVDPPVAPPPEIDVEALTAEAFERGRRSAQAEIAPRLAALEREFELLPSLLRELAEARASALDAASDDVGRIVAALGARLVGAAMIDPDVVARAVRDGLQRMPTRDPVRVRVVPGSADRLRDVLSAETHVEVIADEKLAGGCILESEGARIDGGLAVALEGLDKAIAVWKERR